MAIINTFQCDGCKVLRQGTNHWWVAWKVSGEALTIRPFDGDTENQKDISHFCGIECTQKWLGQRMQEVMGQ